MNYTTGPTPVTLTGTAEAYSTVTVYDNSTQLGTTTTNGSGGWTFTTAPLADGSQSFTATATDSAGNVSPLSSPLVVNLNVPVNLVANGNFATGDFTDWTLGGNDTPAYQLYVSTNAQGASTYAADLDPVGADGTLSQTIATTAGQTYTLSFWLDMQDGGANNFSAIWNGQTLLSLTNVVNSSGYTEYTYTVTATSSTSTLEFSGADSTLVCRQCLGDAERHVDPRGELDQRDAVERRPQCRQDRHVDPQPERGGDGRQAARRRSPSTTAAPPPIPAAPAPTH